MGHKDSGNACFPLNPLDFLPGLKPQAGIQIGERFIQQKHLGPLHQSPCNCHTLLLPAGKLSRLPVHQLLYLHQPGRLHGFLKHLRFGQFVLPLQIFQRKCNILPHGEMRIQGVVLKYQPDAPVFRRQIGNIVIPKEYPAAGGLHQSADEVQRGAFTAARRSQQANQPAVRNFKGKIIDRNHFKAFFSVPARKFLRQVL